MTAKRKNGFETLDIGNQIVVHGVGHVVLAAAFSDKFSIMPESLKNFYNKNQINQVFIHFLWGLIILLVFSGMSKQ